MSDDDYRKQLMGGGGGDLDREKLRRFIGAQNNPDQNAQAAFNSVSWESIWNKV